MALAQEALDCALALLQKHAKGDGDDRVVTDPWSILESAGIAREAVVALMQRKCLVGIGRMRFRIVQEAAAAPESHAVPQQTPLAAAALARHPSFLLVIDVENYLRGCTDAGIPFDPARIFEEARRLGPIAFAFALGNFQAVPAGALERMEIAGANILVNVHCPRLRDGNGGKDTTDETLQALVQRHLQHSRIHGVIFVTDDRDFAPVMNAVLDTRNLDDGTRLRCVRLSLRNESMLDAVGEIVRLTETAPTDSAPMRRWTPDLIIEDLRLLPTLPTNEHPAVLRRIRLRAPFVQRVLRTIIRRYFCSRVREVQLSFRSLLSFSAQCVLPDERGDVSDDDLRVFLDALIEVGVFSKTNAPQGDGSMRTKCRPNWAHPFCAEAVSDIPLDANGKALGTIHKEFIRVTDDQKPKNGVVRRRHRGRQRHARRATATETTAE